MTLGLRSPLRARAVALVFVTSTVGFAGACDDGEPDYDDVHFCPKPAHFSRVGVALSGYEPPLGESASDVLVVCAVGGTCHHTFIEDCGTDGDIGRGYCWWEGDAMQVQVVIDQPPGEGVVGAHDFKVFLERGDVTRVTREVSITLIEQYGNGLSCGVTHYVGFGDVDVSTTDPVAAEEPAPAGA